MFYLLKNFSKSRKKYYHYSKTYGTIGTTFDKKGNAMKNDPILSQKLSLSSEIPLYTQLVGIIKRNISAGDYISVADNGGTFTISVSPVSECE